MILSNQMKKGATHVTVLSMIMLASVLLALPVLAQSDKTKKESKIWAEKLNFPKGKKVLLLHMDDIGMCPEANTAAMRYIDNKNIMSTAVMMPCPNAEEFIEWAKTHPAAEIGLHLTLTSEWKEYRWPPVSDASKVPGLIDPDGKFWHEVPDVVVHASAQEVETEIRAQIEKCLALGYRPTHIDTHMGTLYGSVEYTKAFFKVAEEYNIPANAIALTDPDVVSQFTRQGYPFNDESVRISERYRLPKLDNFTSVGPGPTYEQKRDTFLAMIKSLKPGLTEIIFHPSVQTDNLKSIYKFVTAKSLGSRIVFRSNRYRVLSERYHHYKLERDHEKIWKEEQEMKAHLSLKTNVFFLKMYNARNLSHITSVVQLLSTTNPVTILTHETSRNHFGRFPDNHLFGLILQYFICQKRNLL